MKFHYSKKIYMTDLLLLIYYKLFAIIRTSANMLPRPRTLNADQVQSTSLHLMLFYVLRQVIPSLT